MNVELVQRGGVIKKEIIPNSQSKNCGFGCNGKLEDLGMGRFPANVITDGSHEVAMGMPNTKSTKTCGNDNRENKGNSMFIDRVHCANNSYNDFGSAMRYFYQAKASKKDRDEGLDMFDEQFVNDGCERSNFETAHAFGSSSSSPRKNTHPTVKPIELMQYLIRLVTPKGGAILEPFAGSGSTGKAAMFENRERNANYDITMIELTPEYIPIINARCDYAVNKYKYDAKIEEAKTGQMSLFDFLEEDEDG